MQAKTKAPRRPDPRVLKRLQWRKTARPEQRTPEGEWFVWLLLGGRGFGKTFTAAQDVAWYGSMHPGSRIAVVAETFADGRDVCVEGQSGILNCLHEGAVQHWNRSIGELFLVNGSRYKLFSGDKPDGLRGYEHDRAWVDELAKFRYARETWTQLMLGLRGGSDPRVLVTTTPKPVSIIKELMERDNVKVTRGSTFDNAANLAGPFLQEIRERYEGTRIGQQEILGLYLDDVPGALWDRPMVERAYMNAHSLPDMKRLVTAIDPAVTSGESSDETGIVVAGLGVDGKAYVLDDLTCRLSPDAWARRAVEAYHAWRCDRLIAEVNNGGDLVASVIRTIDPTVAYKKLHASRGKRVRAEPVAALYEQGKVFHTKPFPELEDQMVSFVPDITDGSPDRVDALVWALTELMLEKRGTRKMRVIR